jgi:addiction module HigA family antidote
MLLPKRRKPIHPGAILSEDFLKPLNLTPKEFATTLGPDWTEKMIQDLIDEKTILNDKAAEAFATALGTTVDFWKRIQHHLSHYEEEQRHNAKGSLKPWKKAV